MDILVEYFNKHNLYALPRGDVYPARRSITNHFGSMTSIANFYHVFGFDGDRITQLEVISGDILMKYQVLLFRPVHNHQQTTLVYFNKDTGTYDNLIHVRTSVKFYPVNGKDVPMYEKDELNKLQIAWKAYMKDIPCKPKTISQRPPSFSEFVEITNRIQRDFGEHPLYEALLEHFNSVLRSYTSDGYISSLRRLANVELTSTDKTISIVRHTMTVTLEESPTGTIEQDGAVERNRYKSREEMFTTLRSDMQNNGRLTRLSRKELNYVFNTLVSVFNDANTPMKITDFDTELEITRDKKTRKKRTSLRGAVCYQFKDKFIKLSYSIGVPNEQV